MAVTTKKVTLSTQRLHFLGLMPFSSGTICLQQISKNGTHEAKIMCLEVCVCARARARASRGSRLTSGVIPQKPSTPFVSETVSLTKTWGFSSLTRPAGQCALGSHLSPRPQCCDFKSAPSHEFFRWTLGIELRSTYLSGKHFASQATFPATGLYF